MKSAEGRLRRVPPRIEATEAAAAEAAGCTAQHLHGYLFEHKARPRKVEKNNNIVIETTDHRLSFVDKPAITARKNYTLGANKDGSNPHGLPKWDLISVTMMKTGQLPNR